MKTVGLIGGIGCYSTIIYYQAIIERISFQLGKGHTGNLVIYSIDEYEVIEPLNKKDWKAITTVMKRVTEKIDKSGVDFLIICSNTFHEFFDVVQENTKKPVIHILQPICEIIKKEKFQKIGLIGTSSTLLHNFYTDYLLQRSPVKAVLKPTHEHIDIMERIIFQELFINQINSHSKKVLIEIIQSLINQGAEAVILGCTEFSLIISQKDVSVPVLDSTHLHAIYAADYMIKGKKI
ncbi:MAG TPA: amino acid racemase [Chlamydiales bacterium]|nr:amino acid racemase [Chlamydiales bacterium]